MFIVYRGNDEVLVTTRKRERCTIKEWFTKGGRCVDDYDREEYQENAVQIRGSLVVR